MVAPVFFKDKKDGSVRLCIHYHRLNSIFIENVYPFFSMKDMLGQLVKRRVFTKLREVYNKGDK